MIDRRTDHAVHATATSVAIVGVADALNRLKRAHSALPYYVDSDIFQPTDTIYKHVCVAVVAHWAIAKLRESLEFPRQFTEFTFYHGVACGIFENIVNCFYFYIFERCD